MSNLIFNGFLSVCDGLLEDLMILINVQYM